MKRWLLTSFFGISALCATTFYAIEHEAFLYEIKFCSDGEISYFKKSLYKSALWNWAIPENTQTHGRLTNAKKY
jgi:hypothetical protein